MSEVKGEHMRKAGDRVVVEYAGEERAGTFVRGAENGTVLVSFDRPFAAPGFARLQTRAWVIL